MSTIKVNPDELLANVKKIDKSIKDYEKNCKELLESVNSNEAQLDENTHNALLTSVPLIKEKFDKAAWLLRERNSIIEQVASAYRSINEVGVAGVALQASETAVNAYFETMASIAKGGG